MPLLSTAIALALVVAAPVGANAVAAGLAAANGSSAALTVGAAVSCMDDDGRDVDFAYAFKYPAGYEYAYVDRTKRLDVSSTTLTADTSSVSRTLAQRRREGVSFVVWNDEPAPSGASRAPTAHAKGALLFSDHGGVWLTHSLPKFPSKGDDLWRDASHKYGQSFLCITLSAAEVHKLSPAMRLEQPTVYDYRFAPGHEESFADVKAWAVDRQHDEDPPTSRLEVSSRGGQHFTFFSKSGNWGLGKDLYRDLVAPTMRRGSVLLVESWRHERADWGPSCGGERRVLDTTSVSFPGTAWKTTSDHSKWAVDGGGTMLCVGDLNRAGGQDRRGGGTVCIQSTSLAGQLRRVVNGSDTCDGFTFFA